MRVSKVKKRQIIKKKFFLLTNILIVILCFVLVISNLEYYGYLRFIEQTQ